MVKIKKKSFVYLIFVIYPKNLNAGYLEYPANVNKIYKPKSFGTCKTCIYMEYWQFYTQIFFLDVCFNFCQVNA